MILQLLTLLLWVAALCAILAIGCLYERWYLRRYGWPENYHGDPVPRDRRSDGRPY